MNIPKAPGQYLSSMIAVVLALAGSAPGLAQENSGRVLVLTGATIIDGVADAPLVDRAIVIEGNTIEAILPADSPLPAGAETVDLDGKYVIPGLMDSHVHWLDWMGELFLNHGVTSVVAMANLDPELRAMSQGAERRPRLYHSGDNVPFTSEDGPDTIRRVVREWLENDPDMANFPTHNDASRKAYAVAAEEVHRAGFLIFGHAEIAPDAISDGIDVIEHAWGFTQAAMSAENLEAFRQGEFLTWASFMTDWAQLSEMISDSVEAGAYLNPTLLYEWGGMSERASQRELDDYRVVSDPGLVYFPENIARSLLAKHRQIKNFSSRYENMPFVKYLPETDRVQFEEGYKNVLEFVRRYVQAGGKIQAGTDSISGGMPGLSVHQEMQMLVEAGLTPMQALKSATRWSAELLEGVNGARGPASVGSLEPGKRADLIVLGADPLSEISNTQDIERVMKDGVWIELGYNPEYYTFTAPSRSVAGATFAPVISSVSPASVNAGAGTTRVVLEGSGFLLTSLIRVNGISAKTSVT
ncbi:MAG: amidohydrolase family protein, partial [Gemmatimonadota bacterium]